jgi:S-adenosylmethionine hydrolase
MAAAKPNWICGLITDFGNKDYFTGTMKGVMKKINPRIEVIDIANDIPSYNIMAASFVIDKTFRFFPGFTIFLVVVDPGVGTTRRILLARQGSRYFIAPDNGVLTPILLLEDTAVSVIDKAKYFLINGHSTFEARDKMAPVAAFLSAGIDPKELSSPTSDFITSREYYPTKTEHTIAARVVYIDKFGNIMTNVSRDFLFAALKESGLEGFKAELEGKEISGFYITYAEAGTGPFMLIGSHENLEIAINQGSAAAFFDARIGQPVYINLC